MTAPVATLRIGPGEPLPLGLTWVGDGFNLAIFSRHATGMSVLIFNGDGKGQPIETVALDLGRNRCGDVWHVRLATDFHDKSYRCLMGAGRQSTDTVFASCSSVPTQPRLLSQTTGAVKTMDWPPA